MRMLAKLIPILLLLALSFSALIHWLIPEKYNLTTELSERSPAEITRYLLMRLEGHSKLEAVADPTLLTLQRHLEKPLRYTLTDAKRMGKGQQSLPLPLQRFDSQAGALPVDAAAVHSMQHIPLPHRVLRKEWLVASSMELTMAMAQAQPGDTITLQPGEHALGGLFKTGHAGSMTAPIFVRAEIPGTVQLKMSAYFYVSHPFWIFENLHLIGNCQYGPDLGPCEHAFHVVGEAAMTVIRNNHLQNFLAHIKINGLKGKFPDSGLIQFNTFSNDSNFGVSGALAPVDLVGASRWIISDNLVHHFVKAWSPHASYGIFMKGGGSMGRIERNFLVCTGDGNISHHGSRVGLSIGGGLTQPEFCPDKQCLYEHADGVVANNIVMHCNDFGIDNNRGIRSIIAHNTLINTYGIDGRNVPSSVMAYGNHLSGHMLAKRGGELRPEGNDDSLDVVDYAGALLSQTTVPISEHLVPTHPAVRDDFCGYRRSSSSQAGALTRPTICQAP